MKVTPHLIKFIRAQMQSCALDSKARLARASGISEPTIGRILAGKRSTISDSVAEKLCNTFGLEIEELLMIALNHRSPAETVNETTASYGSSDPEIRRLCRWLETRATQETKQAVFAVAKAGGFIAPGSSCSGRMEYLPAAGAA